MPTFRTGGGTTTSNKVALVANGWKQGGGGQSWPPLSFTRLTMKKATLDRSRSFRTIIGITADGVRYMQDDKDFDAQGDEIVTGKSDFPEYGTTIPVSSGNSAPTPSNPRYVPSSAGTSTVSVAKKKKRKRRTKAQMTAARAGKPGLTKPAVLSTEVFK